MAHSPNHHSRWVPKESEKQLNQVFLFCFPQSEVCEPGTVSFTKWQVTSDLLRFITSLSHNDPMKSPDLIVLNSPSRFLFVFQNTCHMVLNGKLLNIKIQIWYICVYVCVWEILSENWMIWMTEWFMSKLPQTKQRTTNVFYGT